MFCANCGCQNPDGQIYCLNCGFQMANAEANHYNYSSPYAINSGDPYRRYIQDTPGYGYDISNQSPHSYGYNMLPQGMPIYGPRANRRCRPRNSMFNRFSRLRDRFAARYNENFDYGRMQQAPQEVAPQQNMQISYDPFYMRNMQQNQAKNAQYNQFNDEQFYQGDNSHYNQGFQKYQNVEDVAQQQAANNQNMQANQGNQFLEFSNSSANQTVRIGENPKYSAYSKLPVKNKQKDTSDDAFYYPNDNQYASSFSQNNYGDYSKYSQASQNSQNDFESEQPVYELSKSDRILRGIAFGLNIASCLALGIFLIPLCWTIPMTIHSYSIFKGRKANTVAFGVCSVIFINVISGILLLISKHEKDDE